MPERWNNMIVFMRNNHNQASFKFPVVYLVQHQYSRDLFSRPNEMTKFQSLFLHTVPSSPDASGCRSSSNDGNHHKIPNRLLATSAMTQKRILASREIDGPLCRFQKGFFDHLKPRAFVMSVSCCEICLPLFGIHACMHT
jgi:hypothetical protein